MSGHDATAVRLNTGWSRWSAVCPSGCPIWQARGKEEAERQAVAHRNVHAALAVVESELRCECWRGDEQDPYGPCLRCRLRELLGGAA